MSKYILYHSKTCPFSRKIRFLLDEIGVKYKKEEINNYNDNKLLVKLNPALETPILFSEELNLKVVDSYLISDFLKKVEYKNNELRYEFFGNNLENELEINRLQMWFDKKCYAEVTKPLLHEIIFKTYNNNANRATNTNTIQICLNNLLGHIQYIEFLLSKNKWLAGEKFSLADISAATQLSIIDYFGYINWKRNLKLKEWYIVIKSKVGFRDILNDKIPGFSYSLHYNQLDF